MKIIQAEEVQFNLHGVPMARLLIIYTPKKRYGVDTQTVLKYLSLKSRSNPGTSNRNVTKLYFNNFLVSGCDADSADANEVGHYVIFPKGGVAIHIYFVNFRAGGMINFRTMEDYRQFRDAFLNDYTRFLNDCLGKRDVDE